MVASDSVKDLVNRSFDKVVDYGYDNNNKGNSLKDYALSLANDLTPELKDAGLQIGKKIIDKVNDKIQAMSPDNNAPIDGDGLKRYKKGSKEAKEHMAKIRGLKKGLGIVLSAEQVPSSIKPVKGSQAMRDKMAKLRSLR